MYKRQAFTLVAVARDEPHRLVAARRNSPLVVGVGEGENFVASDVAAFIEFTRFAIELGQDQVVDLTSDSITVTAVSYTHLDVYKRQVLRDGEGLQPACRFAGHGRGRRQRVRRGRGGLPVDGNSTHACFPRNICDSRGALAYATPQTAGRRPPPHRPAVGPHRASIEASAEHHAIGAFVTEVRVELEHRFVAGPNHELDLRDRSSHQPGLRGRHQRPTETPAPGRVGHREVVDPTPVPVVAHHRCADPVSYTHLDVYKRQRWR